MVTATILAPLVLAGILRSDWILYSLILIVTSLAAYEISRALSPLPFPAALGAGTVPVALSIPYGTAGIALGTLLTLPWTLLWLAVKPQSRTLNAVLAIFLMALWVGTPLAHLVLLSAEAHGAILVLLAVVGSWISDTAAYFGGRLFGRHALLPSLSPKKTIEGSISSLAVTILAVACIPDTVLSLSFLHACLLGATISLFSQSGDLFESLLKRLLGIKDLGRFLPGHGGMLDRLDSLLFTAPAVYYAFHLL